MENISAVLPDHFTEAETAKICGYTNIKSFRNALKKGTVTLCYSTLGNERYFRKLDVRAEIEANMKPPKCNSLSPFQAGKKAARSLKSENVSKSA